MGSSFSSLPFQIRSSSIDRLLLLQSPAFLEASRRAYCEAHWTEEAAMDSSHGGGGGREGGLRPYQLLSAVKSVHERISIMAAEAGENLSVDPVFRFQEAWVQRPPSEFDIDVALSVSTPFRNQDSLNGKEFLKFAAVVFREMALSGLRHRLVVYVPVGAMTCVIFHNALRRLPGFLNVANPRGGWIPSALIGCGIGVVIASLK